MNHAPTFALTAVLLASAIAIGAPKPKKQVSPAAAAALGGKPLPPLGPIVPSGPKAGGAGGSDVPRDPATTPPPALPPGPLAERPLVIDPGPQRPVGASADPVGNVYLTTLEADSSLKLRKLDATGAPLWAVPIAGVSRYAHPIAGNDGALAVSAERVIRFNSRGEQQFSTRMGQSAGGNVEAVYDGAGGVFVAFLPYPASGRILTRVDRLGGVVFTSSVLPAGPAQMDVSVAADSRGNAFIATGGDQVTVRKFSAKGVTLWTSAVTTVFGVKKNIEVTGDGQGGVLVAWSDARRRPRAIDIFVQAVDANGKVRWPAEGVEIARDPGLLGTMSLTSDGAGGAYVGYTAAGGSADLLRLTASGAKAWATPSQLGAGRPPQIVAESAGVFAVSRAQGDGGPCLKAQRFNAAGAPIWAEGPKVVGTCMHTVPFFPFIVRTQPLLVFTDGRSGYDDVYVWR